MLIIAGVEVDEGRLADICDRYGIAKLQIFGSQARGNAGPDSDIDVLYTLRPGRRLGTVSPGRSPARLCSVTSSWSPR
jgi:predicted nucleotidyltransferase